MTHQHWKKKKPNFVISRQIETQPTATPRDACRSLEWAIIWDRSSATFRWLDDPIAILGIRPPAATPSLHVEIHFTFQRFRPLSSTLNLNFKSIELKIPIFYNKVYFLYSFDILSYHFL